MYRRGVQVRAGKAAEAEAEAYRARSSATRGSARAQRQGDAFLLKKGKHQAVCELWSHPLGWELRMQAAGELLATKVCRSQDEVFDTYDAWKAAMIQKGWK